MTDRPLSKLADCIEGRDERLFETLAAARKVAEFEHQPTFAKLELALLLGPLAL